MIMKLKYLIMMMVISTQSNLFAADKIFKGKLPEIWSEGNLYYPFMVHPESKALLSKTCAESTNGCQALRAVKNKLKISFTEAQLSGGKNPSSLVCSIGHKGQVLILVDSKGRENSFCKFPDQSIVSANDLR